MDTTRDRTCVWRRVSPRTQRICPRPEPASAKPPAMPTPIEAAAAEMDGGGPAPHWSIFGRCCVGIDVMTCTHTIRTITCKLHNTRTSRAQSESSGGLFLPSILSILYNVLGNENSKLLLCTCTRTVHICVVVDSLVDYDNTYSTGALNMEEVEEEERRKRGRESVRC